jgi:hypothetical protein
VRGRTLVADTDFQLLVNLNVAMSTIQVFVRANRFRDGLPLRRKSVRASLNRSFDLGVLLLEETKSVQN